MTEHKAFDQSWFWLWLAESETRKFGPGFSMDQFSFCSSAQDQWENGGQIMENVSGSWIFGSWRSQRDLERLIFRELLEDTRGDSI